MGSRDGSSIPGGRTLQIGVGLRGHPSLTANWGGEWYHSGIETGALASLNLTRGGCTCVAPSRVAEADQDAGSRVVAPLAQTGTSMAPFEIPRVFIHATGGQRG